MKSIKPTKTVLDATDKFGGTVKKEELSNDLALLGEQVRTALKEDHLKVSEVHPFFWSLVETYADRFQQYPFDVNKALISYLELQEYPEVMVRELVDQLEVQFEKTHGRALRKPVMPQGGSSILDDEIKRLRGSLKYAAMVAESSES